MHGGQTYLAQEWITTPASQGTLLLPCHQALLLLAVAVVVGVALEVSDHRLETVQCLWKF